MFSVVCKERKPTLEQKLQCYTSRIPAPGRPKLIKMVYKLIIIRLQTRRQVVPLVSLYLP